MALSNTDRIIVVENDYKVGCRASAAAFYYFNIGLSEQSPVFDCYFIIFATKFIN